MLIVLAVLLPIIQPRRVHLLAVALVGSSCLMYLAGLLTRPPSNDGVRRRRGVRLRPAVRARLAGLARRSGMLRQRHRGHVLAGIHRRVGARRRAGGIAGSAVWRLPLGSGARAAGRLRCATGAAMAG